MILLSLLLLILRKLFWWHVHQFSSQIILRMLMKLGHASVIHCFSKACFITPIQSHWVFRLLIQQMERISISWIQRRLRSCQAQRLALVLSRSSPISMKSCHWGSVQWGSQQLSSQNLLLGNATIDLIWLTSKLLINSLVARHSMTFLFEPQITL